MKIFNKVSVKIAFFLSLSMLFVISMTGFAIFRSFSRELTEETMKKDAQVIIQHGHQLESKFNEMTVLSRQIVMDAVIQNYCKQSDHDYDEKRSMINELNRYVSLYDFSDSIILVCKEEMLWNKFMLDHSFDTKIDTKENDGFLGVWVIDNGLDDLKYIPYKTSIYDLYDPSEKIGELYVLIDLKDIDTWIKELNHQNEELTLLYDDQVIIKSPSGQNEKYLQASDQRIQSSRGKMLDYDFQNSLFSLASYRSRKWMKARLGNVMMIFILLFIIMLCLTLIVIQGIVSRFTKPISEIHEGMERFATGDMKVKLQIRSNDEMQKLAETFNSMVQSIDSLLNQKLEDEKIRKKLKFDMMISKIHPHFIYNTLNSVIVMARKQGNTEVVEMVKSLICILQDSMQVHNDLLFDTIEKECEVLTAYATIQNYRYKNKFDLVIDVEERLKSRLIAKNILEPLVENAIFHGIVPKQGKGRVTVRITENNSLLTIVVEDDGVGMKEDFAEIIRKGSQQLKEYTRGDSVHSIALVNVLERIEYLYGHNGKLEVSSKKDQGTVFTITVSETEE